MTIANSLTVLAIFLGPLVAVQLTRFLDERREGRDRRLSVFKALMATRASGLSPTHIEALNRIDLEFHGQSRKDKEIIAAWNAYLDYLNNVDNTPAELRDDRQKTLLGKLLHRMAQSLNYDFDETRIKNGAYYPRGFAENESAQAAIRDGVKELLEGTRAIPVEVREDPHNQKPLTV